MDVLQHLSQAMACHQARQWPQARTHYEAVLAAQPEHPAALHLLGMLEHQTQRDAQAADLLARASALNPHDPALHDLLGCALKGLGRWREALAAFDRALALEPQRAEAHCNRGNTLKRMDRIEEAVESYQRAIALAPASSLPHTNLGTALEALGRLDEAVACHERAIALAPEHPRAHHNLAFTLLMRGDYPRGWREFEWRWLDEGGDRDQRDFPQPLWLGDAPLAGRTLLLHIEQGMGDMIQLCRYVPALVDQGARVVLEVHPPLRTLLRQLEAAHPGQVRVLALGDPLPAFDVHCPVFSLPLALGTRWDTIPRPGRYLQADPERVAQWVARLGPRVRPRVGLAWSGNAVHADDAHRSIALATLLQGLPPGFDYVSLQPVVREADQGALRAATGLQHFGPELRDFTDTAAVCEVLDAVVSVDTSVAHLAGALGRPTLILLPHAPDWRWGLGRDDSPWYDSVRLLRQARVNDWAGVFARLPQALATLVA